ncbi:MAG: hypothetical protein HZB41_03380 [Ignavibacteriae bacterium]|nr:hypothetical protein [Ignavibacteriota bacterium]
MFQIDNYLYLILDNIAKTKGWGLFLEPGLNKTLNSKFLIQLEQRGYITIKGKNLTDEQIVEYHYLELTQEGRDLYLKFKNQKMFIN